MAVDWLKLRTEYINGGISYRKLAEKHGISFAVLKDKAVKEQWANAREQHANRVRTRTEQKLAEKTAENESEIATIKSRLRLRIYEQLEQRMEMEELGGPEFRRLVQSFKDMCEISTDDEDAGKEKVTVVVDV